MGGRLAAGFGFKLVYLYTAELFPTAIRNTAIGSNSTAGRVGYGVSKLILLKKISCFFATTSLFCFFWGDGGIFLLSFFQGSHYGFFFHHSDDEINQILCPQVRNSITH